MSRPRTILTMSILALTATGCESECDYEGELEAIMPEGIVDCGLWDRANEDPPLACAEAAIADGRDFRFEVHDDWHIVWFSRDGQLYDASRYVGSRWIYQAKVGSGIQVDRCETSIADALADIDDQGHCEPFNSVCDLCLRGDVCAFDD